MNKQSKTIFDVMCYRTLFLALLLIPGLSRADLVGPYTSDIKTLFLLHFDEAAGTSEAVNAGSKGKRFYAVSEAVASTTPPLVTTMLGAAGYVNGATNFNTCMTNPTTGYLFGYDANGSLAYDGDAGGAPNLSVDALAMTNLNIGNGGQTPFTIEALIRPTTLSANQEIVCTDSTAGNRGFQFRITSPGSLTFTFITSGGSASATIPSTGPDAFAAGTWYHVAVVYNGATAQLYWTRLDPANGAAHTLGSPTAIALGITPGAYTGPLCIGNENRNTAGEQFLGSIDEVCISSAARGAGEMQMYSSRVTITQNPISQNVDYNQPVTFRVGGSSSIPRQELPLGYQWRFNSNSIAGATNVAYIITNVAAGNAGYFDCVVTNTIGNAATSAPALLVVGAANFLANRYSFTSDTSDSIGGQWGTNFGNATLAGGKLVLDGTTDTYMQLPPDLFNGANATALTIEFWAAYGANPNNVYAFAFGTTNFVIGQGIIGFNFVHYSPHNGGGQTAAAAPGDPLFSQSVNAAGNLDGRNVHVAVVADPPNKLLSIYTNGVLEAVNTNFTVNISSLNDQLSYIGKSLWVVDPYLNASIDEIRIFKGALSSISLKQSQDQGPNTLLADGPAEFVLQPANTSVPVGQTATFTSAAVGYLPIIYQWFKDSVLIPNATNASYSFVTTLGDNNTHFVVYATNTIGVTTYVTNSSAATLGVFVPPMLTWLDLANGAADSDWNTTSLDWTNNASGGGVIAFAQNNGVIFNSRGSGSPNVNLVQDIVPSSITVDATSDYTLSSAGANGSLSGQGTITKLNSGRLIIDVTNNLTGAVKISGGTLQVGNFGSSGSLGGAQVTNNATLSISRSDAAYNLANPIHGNGVVTYDGGGSVTVSGSSDYTGASAVNSGIVFLTSSTGFGSGNSGTTVANGGQIYITENVDVAEPFTLNGVGDGNGALRKGAAGITVDTAPVVLASDSTVSIDTGATLVLSNTITGGNILTATGGGTLTLATNNVLKFVLNGPAVNVAVPRALGTDAVAVSGPGRLVIGTGLNFTNPVIADVVSPGTVTGLLMANDNTNNTVTTISGPLTFNATAANGGHFYGPLTSGYLNVTGRVTNNVTGMVSSRDGFVRFSGGGDYLFLVENQGTISLGANNGISPNASLSQGASGTSIFDLNGFNQTLTGLSDGGVSSKFVTNSTSTSSTLTMNLIDSSAYSGAIGGKITLVENGTGILFLSASNSYSGNTTVNGGTLELATPTLSQSSTVTVASGAMLQLDFSDTNTVAGLVLNGVAQPVGLYSFANVPTYISGSGTLKVVSIATNPTNITFSVSGNTLTLSWPSDHLGWILQAQTNSLNIGLGANWVDVAGSGSSTQTVVNINRANPTVFYRLRLP